MYSKMRRHRRTVLKILWISYWEKNQFIKDFDILHCISKNIKIYIFCENLLMDTLKNV